MKVKYNKCPISKFVNIPVTKFQGSWNKTSCLQSYVLLYNIIFFTYKIRTKNCYQNKKRCDVIIRFQGLLILLIYIIIRSIFSMSSWITDWCEGWWMRIYVWNWYKILIGGFICYIIIYDIYLCCDKRVQYIHMRISLLMTLI